MRPGLMTSEVGFDLLTAEVLVADQNQDVPRRPFAALDHLQAHQLSSTFGEVTASTLGVPPSPNRACSRNPQANRILDRPMLSKASGGSDCSRRHW